MGGVVEGCCWWWWWCLFFVARCLCLYCWSIAQPQVHSLLLFVLPCEACLAVSPVTPTKLQLLFQLVHTKGVMQQHGTLKTVFRRFLKGSARFPYVTIFGGSPKMVCEGPSSWGFACRYVLPPHPSSCAQPSFSAFLLPSTHAALKVTDLSWQREPKPQMFAENRIGNRRKPQIFAENQTLRALMLESNQSRLEFSISIEIFNLAWTFQSRPAEFPTKIGVWRVARLRFSISLENFNPGGRSWFFQSLNP